MSAEESTPTQEANTLPEKDEVKPSAPKAAPESVPEKGEEKKDAVDWKGYAKIWEARAKKNEDAQKELEELKARLEQQKEAAELKAKIEKIAKATGVPASLIRGSNEKEAKAHAEAIAEAYKTPTAPSIPEAGKFSSATGDDKAMWRNLASKLFPDN